MQKEKLKILVVDDEADLCWVLDQTLKDDGHEITKVERGKAARQIIKHTSFDLAFIDIKLPDDDGLAVAEFFKKNNPNIKVAIISGYYYPGDERLADKDVDGFISKPFDLEQINEMVQKARPSTLNPDRNLLQP